MPPSWMLVWHWPLSGTLYKLHQTIGYQFKTTSSVSDIGWQWGATELTTRFGWESVRLIPRDLGHCPRRQSHRGQWARSRGINPDSHTKRVDNSGSATTVLATKYLYNDAKCLFLSERWVFFLKCWPSLLFWSCDTNRPISINKMGLLPCQQVVVLAKTFFWDYCPASRV